LVGLQPDIIVTFGATATVPVQRETRTIPIVFVTVSDPVASGIVPRLNQPGGNVSSSSHLPPSEGSKLAKPVPERAACSPTDPTRTFRRAATYVDRILRGEKPDDLPVQFPTKFEMVVNRKTATALGLEVPLSILMSLNRTQRFKEAIMNICRMHFAAACLVLATVATQVQAQLPAEYVAHLTAAKNAARFDWVGVLARNCIEPKVGPAIGNYNTDPGRTIWYADPQEVFDNLYFLGTKFHTAWALTTSDGIIIIDTLYYYASWAVHVYARDFGKN
jgi:hypothetical protein